MTVTTASLYADIHNYIHPDENSTHIIVSLVLDRTNIIVGPINGNNIGDEKQILFCRWNFQETHFKWFPACIVEILQYPSSILAPPFSFPKNCSQYIYIDIASN